MMKRRMKVITLLMIALLAVSAPVCAQAKGGGKTAGKSGAQAAGGQRKTLIKGVELTATPAIGLSVTGAPLTTVSGGGSVQASAAQFDIGAQVTLIGFLTKTNAWVNESKYAEMMRNFTAIFNVDLAVGGQLTLKADGNSDNAPVKEGALFQIQALEGYKLEPKQNLYITPALGMGFAMLSVTGTKDGVSVRFFDGAAFSIPLYADLKYFFTDHIGIDVNIINSLNFGDVAVSTGTIVGAKGKFYNTFVLKVGPVFRF